MALNPTTPGVYINEIATLPSSVAGVATGVPAFIGVTETGTLLTPVRIETMLDYVQNFGGAYSEAFTATVTGANADIAITSSSLSKFRLYYHMQMYFANGGGPCWVVPVTHYPTALTAAAITPSVFDKLEEIDEPTLVCVPEAVTLSSGMDTVYDAMLKHCGKMQDRFALMDVITTTNSNTDASTFRGMTLSLTNLKYGAAYYPSFVSSLSFSYLDSGVSITASGAAIAFNTKTLADVKNGAFATGTITISNTDALLATTPDTVTIGTVTLTASASPGAGLFVSVTTDSVPNRATTAANLAAAINANATLSAVLTATSAAAVVTLTMKVAGTAGLSLAYVSNSSVGLTLSGASMTGALSPDLILYGRITSAIQDFDMVLYPSATMAGIYASVDRDRGVWKAPANISVSGVDHLSLDLTAAQQGILNVDATSGKSINAIRYFTGKGNLVWGARTLAGNDNEWRYINVRRLFIYVEESVKKATEFVVFEPNDKNTWTRMKGMIGNFLTDLWRKGALAGSKPEQAFFVNVGIGETMTAQDILEGKMIVRIGMAAVRPAEFIILEFQHKLQES